MSQLNDLQQAKLDDAVDAHNDLKDAKQRRIKAFQDAVDAGVSMATIAEHAGIVRSGVWHIINRAEKPKE